MSFEEKENIPERQEIVDFESKSDQEDIDSKLLEGKEYKFQGQKIVDFELKLNPEEIDRSKISEEEKEEGLARKVDDLKQLNNEAEENIKKLEDYRIIFRECKGKGNQRKLDKFEEFENLVSECENLENQVLIECLNLDTIATKDINDIRRDALGLILNLQRIQQKITRCYSLIFNDEQSVKYDQLNFNQRELEKQEKQLTNTLTKIKEENIKTKVSIDYLNKERININKNIGKVSEESKTIKETLQRINISTISVMGIFVCIFSLVNINMSYFKSLVSTSDNIFEVVAFFLIINSTAIVSLIALFSLIHKFIDKDSNGEYSNKLNFWDGLKNSIFYKREYLISIFFLGVGLFLLYKAPKIYQKDIDKKEINKLKRRISTLEAKLKLIENLDSKVSINYYRN